MKLVSSNEGLAQRRRESRSFLLWLVAAALVPPGCSLWVSAELSDKPAETDGGGGGGGSGQGGAGTSSTSQSGGWGATTSSSQSSSAGSSSSSGEPICQKGRADCDKAPANGCEAMLSSDEGNCGQCHHTCAKDEKCKEGTCK